MSLESLQLQDEDSHSEMLLWKNQLSQLSTRLQNHGYRDGIAQASQQHSQDHFDALFAEHYSRYFTLGKRIGFLECLLAFHSKAAAAKNNTLQVQALKAQLASCTILDDGLSSSTTLEKINFPPFEQHQLLTLTLQLPMDFALKNECRAYCLIINKILPRNKPKKFPPDLYPFYLPVEGENLLERCRDGILLGYLLADLAPQTAGSLAKLTPCLLHSPTGTTCSSQACTPSSSIVSEGSNVFILHANLDTVLSVMARAAGIVVVNAGPGDVIEGKKEQVLGVIWQIVRAHMLCQLSLAKSPELVILRGEAETIEEFLSVKPEQLLIRWVNWSLKRFIASERKEALEMLEISYAPRNKLKYIAHDLIDGEIWVMLMNVLFPEIVSFLMVKEFFAIEHISRRAIKVCELAQLISQEEGEQPLLEPVDIFEENSKLSVAYLCELFRLRSGIPPLEPDDWRLKELEKAIEASQQQPTIANSTG